MRDGVAGSGTITEVRRNHRIRVNGRHPWEVRYRYEVGGTAYEAGETLWDLPAEYSIGAPVGIAYDASDPGRSALKRA